jgi:ABC-type lipoprotein export system ATPase subunit
MIHLENIRFAWPRGPFRLRVRQLDVEPGTRLAVVGPSGCGKTTLLHLMAGIEMPRAGTVRVGDAVVSAMGDAARRNLRIRTMGLVFQDLAQIDYLNVLDNILLPCRINRTLRLDKEARERARELAGAVGLAGMLRRRVDQLSQGERQRVAICRAMLLRPRVVLADEPTGNLDPANKGAVVDLLMQQAELAGATLVMVTHDHDLLDRFDRVVDLARLKEEA